MRKISQRKISVSQQQIVSGIKLRVSPWFQERQTFDLPAAAAHLVEEAKSGTETQGTEASESRSSPPFKIFSSAVSL